MMTGLYRHKESGAAAIFIVVFASILMMVVTISFVKLMLSDQLQATTNDLSQSAYNSALSGVEDGKRLLLLQQSCDGATPPSLAVCSAVKTAIADQKCNTIQVGLASAAGDEVPVGAAALSQSYTCVKIIPNTLTYDKTLITGQSQVVPLKSTGAFDAVSISWYSSADLSSGSTINFPNGSGPATPLPKTWPADAPPIVRAQFIQTGSSFTMADLDATQGSNSIFLYPFKNVGLPVVSMTTRRTPPPSGPVGVKCSATFVSQYACSITIAYPQPAGWTYQNRGAYLRLNSVYGDTHYSVQLLKSGAPVAFDGVQPIIDVTGRAQNMFRRVLARVEFAGSFVYPEAAIDMQNNLCKDFSVTDTSYTPGMCDQTKQN